MLPEAIAAAGCGSVVEGVVGPVHEGVLAEHGSHPCECDVLQQVGGRIMFKGEVSSSLFSPRWMMDVVCLRSVCSRWTAVVDGFRRREPMEVRRQSRQPCACLADAGVALVTKQNVDSRGRFPLFEGWPIWPFAGEGKL